MLKYVVLFAWAGQTDISWPVSPFTSNTIGLLLLKSWSLFSRIRVNSRCCGISAVKSSIIVNGGFGGKLKGKCLGEKGNPGETLVHGEKNLSAQSEEATNSNNQWRRVR